MLKTIRRLLEAALVGFVYYFLFRALPLNTASNLAGWVARNLGKWLKPSQEAKARLKRAIPEIDEEGANRVIAQMWDNFASVIVEYARPNDFWDGKSLKHIEVIGHNYLEVLRDDNKPGIIFSAHIGSWQMITHIARAYGLELMQVYRAANNPWVDHMMWDAQKAAVAEVTKKGKQGARDLMGALGSGKHIMMLVDQKMSDGIAVPFFGRPAMTAPAIARLALRYNCPILPARCERLSGSSFRVTFFPPLAYPAQGNINEDSFQIMKKINEMIEDWVRQTPGQWLWIHNRWGD